MPSLAGDPALLSKRRLRSALPAHSGFSSDEEDESGGQPGGDEEAGIQDEGQSEEVEVMDVSQLTDMELKARLLQYGVNVGPIVASTRTLYEKKLQKLLKPVSEPPFSGATYAAQYSDGEDDGDDDDDDEERDSVHTGSHLEADEEQDGEGHSQSLQMRPQQVSVDELRSPPCAVQSFSITQLVEELESRSPDVSKAATGGSVGGNSEPRPGASTQMDLMTKDRNATSKQPFSPKLSGSNRQFKQPVTDILMEMFPGTERTLTGISATCRRPIKGAAGRPVQFKYPNTPSSPGTEERRELQRHLVPLWIQILVFLFVAFLFYLIFSAMEGIPDSPFAALQDRSGHEGEELGGLSSFATSEDPPLVSGEE